MSCLLGLSMDCNGFPSLLPHAIEGSENRFGVVIYPLGCNSASIVKNLHLEDKSKLDRCLYSGKNFGAATLLAIHHPDYGEIEKEQFSPFLQTYAGRDWVMVATMSLSEDFRNFLPLPSNSFFIPPNIKLENLSQERYVFCWIMEQLHQKKCNYLSDLEWPQLHEHFQAINQYGNFELIFSDGRDMVIYCGMASESPFIGLRSTPPHANFFFEGERFTVGIDALDLNHTLVLFSNQRGQKLQERSFTMQGGQMIAVRHGEYIYDNCEVTCQWRPSQAEVEPQAQHLEEGAVVRPQGGAVIQRSHSIYLSQPASGKLEYRPLTTPSENFCLVSNYPDPQPAVYSIVHESTYNYDKPVGLSKHLFRLHPTHDLTQSVLKFELSTSVKGEAFSFVGTFGNNATIYTISEPYTTLKIVSRSVVAVCDLPPIHQNLLHQQLELPLVWMPWDRVMMQAYLVPSELPESELIELSQYAMGFVKRNNNDVLAVLQDINRTIYNDYAYISGSTSLSTSAYQVYSSRRGVCQDFANLFICMARLLNIPARYRVGYIYTGTDYANKIQSDASHAWLEVFLPSIGWMGFDPTNNCIQSKNHIRMASGRNYRDATPTSGTIFRGGGLETFTISVRVVRIDSPSEDLSQ